MARVYVALGSNLGDRAAFLRLACASMGALPRSRVVARSRVYETEAVGPVAQGPFLNAVVQLDTALGPLALLHHLQAIERQAGRQRGERWGPRPIDLDLLFYEDRIIATNDLILPHPRLHERRFVLQPLCDLAPQWIHPSLDEPMETLLAKSPPAKVTAVTVDW